MSFYTVLPHIISKPVSIFNENVFSIICDQEIMSEKVFSYNFFMHIHHIGVFIVFIKMKDIVAFFIHWLCRFIRLHCTIQPDVDKLKSNFSSVSF